MLCVIAIAASVGYASAAPTSQHTEQGEKAAYIFNAPGQEAPILLAQLEAPASEVTATEAPEVTPAPAPVVVEPSKVDKAAEQVLEIANALNVEVDTAASPDEIYKQVLEQAQTLPKKGSSPADWISWVLAVLGLGGTIFFFVKNQKLKKSG